MGVIKGGLTTYHEVGKEEEKRKEKTQGKRRKKCRAGIKKCSSQLFFIRDDKPVFRRDFRFRG